MAEQRLPYERRVDDFLRIVRAAQRDIAARVAAAIRTGDLQQIQRRRLQLAAVVAVLDQLEADVLPIARQLVQEAHEDGAHRAAKLIGGLRVDAPEVPGVFHSVSLDTIRVLQDQITGRLSDSVRTVGRTVDDVYARAGRRAALRAALGADGSPRAARQMLVADLMRDRDVKRMVKQGGFGFVDKAGKRWALDTYAEMVVRTVTRQAVVEGSLARMASHGITLARVSTHAGACKVCQQWQGRLVSLDGKTGSHLGEPVAVGVPLPPYHPNCAHSLQPVSVAIERFAAERAAAGA